MRKSYTIIGTASILMLSFFFLISTVMLTDRIKQETPQSLPGYADLSNFDFSEKLANIPHTSFLYYRGELYTPEDFHLGRIGKQPIILNNAEMRFDPGEYGTYYIALNLPDNRIYGLSSYSAMYSQRLFVNGEEYPSVGLPGKTAEETIPKTSYYTIYFAPDEGQAEIIIQFANFNHSDYGGIVPVLVGSQESITQRDAVSKQRIHILIGCTLTAFLFFIGMFFIFRNRLNFLWFSLACLAIVIRKLIVDEKVIMILNRDLPWHVSIAIEYLALIVLLFTFLLYINSMFQSVIHKYVLWGYGSLCIFYTIIILLTPPIIYTRFILWFQLISALFGIYVGIVLMYNVLRKKDNRKAENFLILTGVLIFITMSMLDIEIHRSSGFALALGLSGNGMIILIFVNMIAITIKFYRTEIELDEARRNEREMQETNQLLDKMSRLKSDFLANISHEMRTPLTVIASYAGLTSMQIQRNATNEKTIDNLVIVKREAIRLAELVEQIKVVSLEKEYKLKLTDIEAGILLKQAADFCENICLKNKNRITVCLCNEKVFLCVNVESIFQTLINLIINANRHTKESVILLKAENYNEGSQVGFIKVTVSDDGDGIDPQLLPNVFTRGVSGDDSSGLGLAISKGLIEDHGGQIWIESEKGKGTVVYFTIPCCKGDDTP